MSHESTDRFLYSIAEDPLPKRFFKWIEHSLSIGEYVETPRLIVVAYALLLAFFTTFTAWFYDPSISMSTAASGKEVCWPYAQWCGNLYFLEALPLGYSQSIFYTGIFLLLIATTYAYVKREYTLGHLGILLLWSWKVLVVFLLKGSGNGNYDYYDIVLGAVLLFFPKKLPTLQWMFVLFYVLCSTIKFSDGWILGRYFSSMENGLPIFEHFLTPLWTNLVILDQLLLSWFLLSENAKWRRTALITFFVFHLYSTTLVGFRYPTTSLVTLIVLFESFDVRAFKRFVRAKWVTLIPAATLTVFLLGMQLFASYSYGLTRVQSLETNDFGFYMFEANHQCISTQTIHHVDGSSKVRTTRSSSAHDRCTPYKYWFKIKNQCAIDSSISHIEWKFLHSTNGDPYMVDVDTSDACSLTYEPWKHNEWIRDTVATDILPQRNFYGSMKTLPTDEIEQIPNEHISSYVRIYWSLWILSLFVGFYIFIKKRTQE